MIFRASVLVLASCFPLGALCKDTESNQEYVDRFWRGDFKLHHPYDVRKPCGLMENVGRPKVLNTLQPPGSDQRSIRLASGIRHLEVEALEDVAAEDKLGGTSKSPKLEQGDPGIIWPSHHPIFSWACNKPLVKGSSIHMRARVVETEYLFHLSPHSYRQLTWSDKQKANA